MGWDENSTSYSCASYDEEQLEKKTLEDYFFEHRTQPEIIFIEKKDDKLLLNEEKDDDAIARELLCCPQ